jgi:hypothetical protein
MSMSPEYQEFYQQLLTAFHSHNAADRTEMERIEACFKSSLECWTSVCEHAQKGFSEESSEIHFFKEVKPVFTGYIEYYTYRYHAVLFQPEEDMLEWKRFWRWEQKKIERFYENNREFCVYMESGDTSRDHEFFLRTQDGGCSEGMPHDPDWALISPKDHVAMLLKAYQLYEEYIRCFISNNQNSAS